MSEDRNDERPEERFRRPRFEPRGQDEPEARLPSAPVPHGVQDIGMFAEPLHRLADAFRENTEALKSIAEGQARLGKRIEKSDRSEAVIQSTQALNDTFRGVQRTQEVLLARVEDERKRPWLMLLGVVAGMAILVGGVLYFLTGWFEEQEERSGNEGIAVLSRELEKRESALGALEDDLDGREDEIEGLKSDLVLRAEDLLRQKSLTREQQLLVDQLQERVQLLEQEKRGFAQTQADAARTMRENAGLAAESERLSREIDRLRGELSAARGLIGEKDAELAELSRRIEALVLRETGAVAPAQPGPMPAAGMASDRMPGGDTMLPPGAVTDSAQLARIQGILNRLLRDAGDGETYEFAAMGGVRGKVLYQVALVSRDETGREAKRIEGGECRVSFEAARREAVIALRNGHILYYGVKAPFPGNRLIVRLPNIDPSAWQRSGLTVVEAL